MAIESKIHRGMNTRERIISLIESFETSYKDFEKKFDLKPGTVSEWKRGRMFNYMDYLVEVADEYNVTTDWLLGREPDDSDEFDLIPIEGKIQAGYPIQSFVHTEQYIKIPLDEKPGGELFALEVVGDSMMPLVMDGDIIILKKSDVANDKICAVTIDNESTLKRVRLDKAGVTLIPTNPMYKEMYYSAKKAEELGFRIDGVLVQMIRNF